MRTRSVDVVGYSLLRLARTGVSLARAWQRRRLVGRLATFDDRMLADIGITRQDVESVLAYPAWIDPSQKLADRARAARQGRRAMVREGLLIDQLSEAPPSRRAA